MRNAGRRRRIMRGHRDRTLMCRIFIEQRDGGKTWIPYKTLIGYGMGNRVVVGSQGEQTYCSRAFATLGAATEAAEQAAWDIIQIKFPHVRRSEVDWHVMTESVGGFVPV
jgi:hypothetical protein